MDDNIEIKENLRDVSAEGLVVGSLYKRPELLFEYEDLIYPEWDFTVKSLKFYYDLIKHCYLSGYQNIDETLINIEISKNDAWMKEYKRNKGYKTIIRLMEKANPNDFFTYFTTLKKFNLLRELDRKGFPVENDLEKFINKDAESIYNYYDYRLSKTLSHHQGINDSIIIGKDMPEVFEQYLESPDIGIPIPYHITNSLIRGWRKGKLNAIGLHSGFGKSRMMCNVVVDIGINNRIPILVIANEQQEDEWQSMILTSVVNNYFVKDKDYIGETEIVTGDLTNKQKELCREAALWIKNNSSVYFQEAQIYDFNTLKRTLKVHRLKGVNYFLYDTLKPFRSKDVRGATWEMFVQTSEMLKQLCGSKEKGGLDMGGWITFQLTDDSIFSSILNSTSIASGKHIKHNVDFLAMARPLTWKEKQNIKVKLVMPDSPFDGNIADLDTHKDYYIMFVDKNRSGKDKSKIILRVDKSAILFRELGFATFKNKEDEDEMQNSKVLM